MATGQKSFGRTIGRHRSIGVTSALIAQTGRRRFRPFTVPFYTCPPAVSAGGSATPQAGVIMAGAVSFSLWSGCASLTPKNGFDLIQVHSSVNCPVQSKSIPETFNGANHFIGNFLQFAVDRLRRRNSDLRRYPWLQSKADGKKGIVYGVEINRRCHDTALFPPAQAHQRPLVPKCKMSKGCGDCPACPKGEPQFLIAQTSDKRSKSFTLPRILGNKRLFHQASSDVSANPTKLGRRGSKHDPVGESGSAGVYRLLVHTRYI